MSNLNIFDYFLLFSLLMIWITILINIILIMGGFLYYVKSGSEGKRPELSRVPFVSILVPAHNEAKVIGSTVRSLISLDYPKESYEIIVINDNSSDDSSKILEKIQSDHPEQQLQIINTDKTTGGKGKSNALNLGLAISKGEFIAVYDADNTPEKVALIHLVHDLVENEKLGAVIGKFRCRNKHKNLLTHFINIEGICYQWMAQAGRWHFFNLCTIPGTNFVMRRSILEAIDGWDTKAVTEDTEISFRIYRMGYQIKFNSFSVTWEQEPENLEVWFKQRTRWAKGNHYVVIKNFKYVFDRNAGPIRFDILYYTFIYFFFFMSAIMSDLIFILGFGGIIETHLQGYTILLWLMAYLTFVLSLQITLLKEKGEGTFKNLVVIMIMYFTYCKLWVIVTIIGLYSFLKDVVFKREAKWYKTERFD